MTEIIQLDRRRFLQATGLAGGGLLLGGMLPNQAIAGAPAWAVPSEGIKQLNLFVQVASDNTVYIVCHRSEMGQGIRTGLPQIVADELEADWGLVKVIQAPANPELGSQNTDGSRSIRKFYQTMREMGAAAKIMLEQAAADFWQVPISEVKAQNHQVIHSASKRVLSFGQLAELASQSAVPEVATLKLKAKKDFNYIGKGLAPVDQADMVVGNTTYGMDVDIAGMRYVMIERCPVLGGKIKSYDKQAVLKVPGVLDVVEMKATTSPWHFNPLNGVAVIASNTWAAIEGRKALNCQWDLGKRSNYDSKADIAAKKERVKQAGEIKFKGGNVEETLAQSAINHSATYSIPFNIHAVMEPPAATAWFHDGICEIWACTQTPQSAQKTTAQYLGLKPEQIKVNVTLLGGGFGRKSKPDFVVEAAYLAQQVDAPVKVVWSREDEIKNGYYQAAAVQYLEAGLTEQGKLSAWLTRACYPTIAATFNPAANTPQDWEMMQGFANVPFDVVAQQGEVHPFEAPVRMGWLRSVDNIHHAFATGSFIDELAYKAKQSPLEFWLNAIGKDRIIDHKAVNGYTDPNYGEPSEQYPFDTARLKNALRVVAEKSNYGASLPKGQGWGICCHYSFLTYVAVVAKVEVTNNTIKVLELHCSSDSGLVVNPDRVKSQHEGAMLFGLSIALFNQIDIEKGAVKQSNFYDFQLARINHSPDVAVYLIESDHKPTGVGEPGVPPVAPAIANAVFAASGERVRDLPLVIA